METDPGPIKRSCAWACAVLVFAASLAEAGRPVVRAWTHATLPEFHSRILNESQLQSRWLVERHEGLKHGHTVWTAHDARKPQVLFEASAPWTWRRNDTSSLRVRWSARYLFAGRPGQPRAANVQSIVMMFSSSEDALKFACLLADDSFHHSARDQAGTTVHSWDRPDWLRFVVAGPLFIRANTQEPGQGVGPHPPHVAVLEALLGIARSL